MRRAGYDSGWLLTPAGDTLGFSLHGDACTEHEVGVRPLKSALGVPDHFERGLPDRVNTRLPQAFHFETYTQSDGSPAALLLVGSPRYAHLVEAAKDPTSYLGREVSFRAPFRSASSKEDPKRAEARADFAGAWDEDGCLVHVRGPENVHHLKKMAQAFEACDIAFGGQLAADQPHQRVGGLTFVRASQVDADVAAEVLAKDESENRLRQAAEKILPALKADLKAAGKSWFAISPAWRNKQNEAEGLMFWLNPTEQRDYHSGWYTEDNLRAWGRNEGPILRDKALENAARSHQPELEKIYRALHRAHITRPHFTTVRDPADAHRFLIRVSYEDQPCKKGWTKLKEGDHTMADLTLQVPSPPARPRRPRP